MEIEFSVLNIIFVTITIFVIYAIGYVHGYSKGLASNLLNKINTLSDKKVYKYVIEGVEYTSPLELDVRQLRIEQHGDVYYAYDIIDDSYICRASSKIEFYDEIKKYAAENKKYGILYWISSKDILEMEETLNG